MARYSIGEIVEEIRALANSYDPNADECSITSRRFRVELPVPWDKRTIENTFSITIPPDLEELWDQVSLLHLFMFGDEPEETGVVIEQPDGLSALRAYAERISISRYLRADDLVIGADNVLLDFIVVIRC